MTTTLAPHAETVAKNRYYLKNNEGETIEDGNALFSRVAEAIAKVEDDYLTLPVEKDLLKQEFIDIMERLEFIPNSPTLMNAGTEQGTLSACFVLPLEDSMQDIMKTAHDMAMVQKFGGGTGFSLSHLRPAGTRIKTTHGKACGPIEVLKTLSRVSSMVTQAGKRDGANMAVMSVYHPDILDFIDCKSTEGDIHNFNISVGVDSGFMKMVEYDLSYGLVDPHTNHLVDSLSARYVFQKIVDGAWRNGEPGMIFLDEVNKDNKVITDFGEMIATNPCGEQPLLGNESCNLGSINVAQFYQPVSSYDASGLVSENSVTASWEEHIDWQRLAKVTRLAANFLDNVIDANYYATPEIEEMTKATRKIGIGIMGFADLLIQLRVPYNSEDARKIAGLLMQYVTREADLGSLELAAKRGTFPAWDNSSFNQTTEAYRNACRMTVAPTGTISMLADCSSGIEPTFALAWRKQNILKEETGEAQTLMYVNKYFEQEAKEREFYSEDLMDFLAEGGSLQDRDDVPNDVKEIYITSPELLPEEHVLMQAAFQPHVDSGISKTINMPNDATVQDVWDTYMLAWKTECKGITVYRAGSRETEILVKGTKNEDITFDCCENPNIIYESGCHKCLSCDWSACEIA